MTGRDKFLRIKFLINFFLPVFKITPRWIKSFLWDVISPFSGNLSVVIRYMLVKSRCAECGDNVFIGANVTIRFFEKLKIGENVSIHTGCYIDAAGNIEIGNNVSIAHHSSLISFNHTWDQQETPIKYNPVVYEEILIKDDVWIGCGARIMPGVIIQSRSIVAAGAVVVKNVESNSLVGGIPAKKIKWLTE